MGQPAAKEGDEVKATDIHIEMVPSPSGSPVPTPLPNTFSGKLDAELSSDVKIMGKAAAVVGSTATNSPEHRVTVGTSFQSPPSNKGTVKLGSQTVTINGKAAARNGDICETCNDPSDLPGGQISASGTVKIGG
jgi:uncharacterized Zn-binding protein involved in type VI secretion